MGAVVVPINMDYSSSDSDDSAQIGEDFHGELYSSDLDKPGSQQRTPSLPKQISSFSTEKNLMCMLQQQQALLQRVIDGQKRLEERQDSFEDQLTSLASKVEQPAPTTPFSSSSEGKRKRAVTRTLSVSDFNMECTCITFLRFFNNLELAFQVVYWGECLKFLRRLGPTTLSYHMGSIQCVYW